MTAIAENYYELYKKRLRKPEDMKEPYRSEVEQAIAKEDQPEISL